MQIKDLINAFSARLCHDLIGPLGTAQMALEINDEESLKRSIETAIARLEIFRAIFNQNPKLENVETKLNEYVKLNNLNFELKLVDAYLGSLYFWLMEKMHSKSEIKKQNDEIVLKAMSFSEAELDALRGTGQITPGTILPWLVYFQNEFRNKIQFQKINEKDWKIIITKEISSKS